MFGKAGGSVVDVPRLPIGTRESSCCHVWHGKNAVINQFKTEPRLPNHDERRMIMRSWHVDSITWNFMIWHTCRQRSIRRNCGFRKDEHTEEFEYLQLTVRNAGNCDFVVNTELYLWQYWAITVIRWPITARKPMCLVESPTNNKGREAQRPQFLQYYIMYVKTWSVQPHSMTFGRMTSLHGQLIYLFWSVCTCISLIRICMEWLGFTQ